MRHAAAGTEAWLSWLEVVVFDDACINSYGLLGCGSDHFLQKMVMLRVAEILGGALDCLTVKNTIGK